MEKLKTDEAEATVQNTPEQLAGVGIFFKHNESKLPVVESLLPAGSAERTGGIEIGDVLVKVGNVLCERLPMERIRTLVCGPLGSYVSLAFRRRGMDGSFFYYEIELVRGTGQYLDLIERSAFLPDSADLSSLIICRCSLVDTSNLELARERDRFEKQAASQQMRIAALKVEARSSQPRP